MLSLNNIPYMAYTHKHIMSYHMVLYIVSLIGYSRPDFYALKYAKKNPYAGTAKRGLTGIWQDLL